MKVYVFITPARGAHRRDAAAHAVAVLPVACPRHMAERDPPIEADNAGAREVKDIAEKRAMF
jgi:hypothetical protein